MKFPKLRTGSRVGSTGNSAGSGSRVSSDSAGGVGGVRGGSRRWVWVVAAVVVAVLLVVGTWLLAARFQSPAQREAGSLAPQALPVVVEVVRADLGEQTTTMGTAERDAPRSLELPLASGGVSVVTSGGVGVGEELSSGRVALWVNDRPVFAFEGSFPLFRDLGVGDKGDDVVLVQQVLSSLGYDIGVDGEFGSYTAWALSDWYDQVGSQAHLREVEKEGESHTGGAGTDTAKSDEASKSDDSAKAGEAAKSGEASAAGDAVKSSSRVKKEAFLPLSEVVVVENLPATVAKVPAKGTRLNAESAKLGLSGDKVVLSAAASSALASRLGQGLPGVASDGKSEIAVVIKSVGAAPAAPSPAPDANAGAGAGDGGGAIGPDGVGAGRGGGGEDSKKIVFLPAKGVFPDDWVGRADILITLDLVEPMVNVLQVPQRAIAEDAQGGSSVLVSQSDDSFKQVPVEVLGCVAGMCALSDGSVGEGDVVRVDR